MNRLKRIFVILILIFPVILIAQNRLDMPNDFGMEMLGKSVLYGLSCQRMITHSLGLQGDLSLFGAGFDFDNDMIVRGLIVSMAMGMRFYFMNQFQSPFVTGGKILSGLGGYNYLGLGFEYRSRDGLLLRWTVYGLYGSKSFLIWPGVFVGFAFD